MKPFLRYLAPNIVTAVGIVLGLLSMVAAYEGRFVDAGWLIIWAVLTDRLDGGLARLLDASSGFGVQMDSLADFLNFGVAPTFLVYTSLRSIPQLGFHSGGAAVLLAVACITWVLCNAARLARFNVAASGDEHWPVYFGVPTTLAAGILVIWYLVMLKYSPAGFPLTDPDAFRWVKIMGAGTLSLQTWSYLPIAMLIGGLLMISNLPIPKLARKSNRWVTGAILVLTGIGYLCGFTRSLPDVMAWMPSSWLVWSLIWGVVSTRARALEPPGWLELRGPRATIGPAAQADPIRRSEPEVTPDRGTERRRRGP